MTIRTIPERHPVVPHRRLGLSEADQAQQVHRGLYTVQRGERLAIPVDRLAEPTMYLNRDLWRQDGQGRVFRKGTVLWPRRFTAQRRILAFLRDHVHPEIPYWYYLATLGHDLHVSTWAELYARHWHAGWANPFEPERLDHAIDLRSDGQRPETVAARLALLGRTGFVEDLGLLSAAKVSDVFVNVEVGALVDSVGTGQAAEFNDFNEHEVGTSSQVESNNDTALIVSSAIALVAGTQVDDGGDPPTMTTVATITADVTETWEEHGVFSTSIDSLLDRSLTGGQSVALNDQVQYTYTITVNPEA